MLTKMEQKVKTDLEAQGWTVLRAGWPDFLIYRKNLTTGEITSVHPLEVKPDNHRALSASQKEVAAVLKTVNLPVVVYSPSDGTLAYSMLSTRDRIRLGMRNAKLVGKQIGRTPRNVDRAGIAKDHQLGMSLSKIGEKYQIPRSSVARICKQAKEQHALEVQDETNPQVGSEI